MSRRRLAIPLRTAAALGRPAPCALTLDLAELGRRAAGAPVRADLRSVRLERGPSAHPAAVSVRPLADATQRDAERAQPVELTWLEGIDTATDLLLSVDVVPEATWQHEPGPPWFPRVQFVPQPGKRLQASLDQRLLLEYHYDPSEGRPFLHPLLGPAGVPLTRMGHPTDAEGRSHQDGLWIAHREINGENFWDARAGHGRQRHQSIERLEDGPFGARMSQRLQWERATGQPVLAEHRHLALWTLPNAELLLDVTLEFTALAAVTLGRSPYGLLGLRVNRSLSVEHGGGSILNSAGAHNESEALHQRARWCDYSGPVATGLWNGIAILDHDSNPHHPCCWQVRDDGWFGPSPCYEGPLVLAAEEHATFRYRLVIHEGDASGAALDQRFEDWVDPPRLTVGEPALLPPAPC